MTREQARLLKLVESNRLLRGELADAKRAVEGASSYAVGLPSLVESALAPLYELRKVVRLAAAAHNASSLLTEWSEAGDAEVIWTLGAELEGAISTVRAVRTWQLHFASETAPLVKLAERIA